MATTVTYEGNTIATVENTTKTLQTKGTWLTDDITLTDTTAGGGGGWVRPADFPDLSQMDITGEVLYLSYMADEAHGFCSFKIGTNSGQYTAEIGDIVNGAFVADSTYTLNSNAWFEHYFGSPSGGYKVVRVTGNIKEFTGHDASSIVTTAEGVKRFGTESGMVEAYGNLPNHKGNFSWRTLYYLQSLVVRNVKPTTLWYAFQDSTNLQNIETKTWDMQYCTNMQVAFRSCSSLTEIDCEDWNTSNVTNMNGTFQNCISLRHLDVSKWDTGRVTNVTSFVQNCTLLEKIDMSNFVGTNITNLDSLVRDCPNVAEVKTTGWDTSNVTVIHSMFAGGRSLIKFPLEGLVLSSVTGANSFLNGAYAMLSFTVPASLSVIGSQAFFNTRNAQKIHFLATTPPTLQNTNAFTNLNDYDGFKIVVPYSADHSVLNAYKTATNWSTYANNMEEESA